MDIPSLMAFIAVAEHGSFSAAGAELHLTQPAVSKRVAQLELGLGQRLFDRVGHRVLLTRAGEVLLPRARCILQEISDTRRVLANLRGLVDGSLSMVTSHHIGLRRLPPVLRLFTERYPQVSLRMAFLDSEAACVAVERGEAELGVVTLPRAQVGRLWATPLWEDPLEIVVAANHALACKSRVTYADLNDYPALLPAVGTYTREALEEALLPHGVALQVGQPINYLETIRMMVSVGLGWSALPAPMVEAPICALHLPGLRVSRMLGVVQHRDRTPSNAALALRELLGAVTRPGEGCHD